jgi:hypothetical protein
MTKTKSEAEGEFYNATLQREDKRNALIHLLCSRALVAARGGLRGR